MSGSARVVSSGRSRLLRGMDALWHELDRQRAAEQRPSSPPRSPSGRTDSPQRRSMSSLDASISPILGSTSQNAGRLFSNVSSFLSRRQREISQAMETNSRSEGSAKSSDDDAYVDVGAMYPLSNTSNANVNSNDNKSSKDILDI